MRLRVCGIVLVVLATGAGPLWAESSLVLPAAATTSRAAAAGSRAKGDDRAAEALVATLSVRDFTARQNAVEALIKMGKAARPALEAASRQNDPEVAALARHALEEIAFALPIDTPAAVRSLVGQYRATHGDEQLDRLNDLIALTPAQPRVLLAIYEFEANPAIHTLVMEAMFNRSGAALAAAGKDDALAQELFDAGLRDHPEVTLPHWAAWQRARGTLDSTIVALTAARGKETASMIDCELAALFLAKGDSGAALAAARRGGNRAQVISAAAEAGDWRALAEWLQEHPNPVKDSEQNGAVPPGEIRPTQLSCQAAQAGAWRLAGDTARCDAALGALEAMAGAADKIEVARALAMLQHPDEAIDVLVKAGANRAAAQFMWEHGDFPRFLAMAERVANARLMQSEEVQREAAILQAQAAERWRACGETEKSDAALEVLAQRAGQEKNAEIQNQIYIPLIRAEATLGQRDRAMQHAAELCQRDAEDSALWALYGSAEESNAAQVWWSILAQRRPNLSVARRLLKVDAIVRHTLPADQVDDLGQMAASYEAQKETPDGLGARLPPGMVTSEVLRAVGGEHPLGLAVLPSVAEWAYPAELGDSLARLGLWSAAACCYHRAAATDDDEDANTVRILEAWALERAGRQKEAKELRNETDRAILGDAGPRTTAAERLEDLGDGDAALEQIRLVLSLGVPLPENDRELQVKIAEAGGKYEAAIRAREGQIIGYLAHDFPQLAADDVWRAARSRHALRAQLAAREKRYGDVADEIRALCAMNPLTMDIPLDELAALDGAGHGKDLDEILATIQKAYDAHLSQFPKDAITHNNLAWVLACVQRNLDSAEAHGKRAVELAPMDSHGWDTLALVTWELGRRDEALALEQKAMDLSPEDALLLKQYHRLQEAPPAIPRAAAR